MILIGLTGRAGAGKSTVAQYLVEQHGFDELTFAQPLKEGLAIMLRELGVSLEDFEDPARKLRDIPEVGVTPRHLITTLGTEWGRDMVSEGVWVRVLAKRLANLWYSPAVVISDVRFTNEAQWIRELGGQIWLVARPAASRAAPEHASEAGIDLSLVTCSIMNDDDVPAIHARVDHLINIVVPQ